MKTTTLSGTLFVALAASAPASAIAADFLLDSSATAYRLSAEKLDAFRYPGEKMHTSPHGLSTEKAALPDRLADRPYSAQIARAAHRTSVDPALVHAVIYVESGYNARARSSKGALGLMQVMPETALRYGVANAALTPEANLKAGTRYLSDLIKLFDNRLDLALAAYNAGENAVIRQGMRIPPYPETRAYVPAVLAKYHEFRGPVSPPSPAQVCITYLPGTRLGPASLNAAK